MVPRVRDRSLADIFGTPSAVACFGREVQHGLKKGNEQEAETTSASCKFNMNN